MKKLLLYTGILTAFLVSTGNLAQAQHKPMSEQGKGAIIGGAGGAVVGGIIGHNVGGALIGGAIGAGGGYVIGNESRKAKEKKELRLTAEHIIVNTGIIQMLMFTKNQETNY